MSAIYLEGFMPSDVPNDSWMTHAAILKCSKVYDEMFRLSNQEYMIFHAY